MAINKKLIHFKQLADFQTRLANNEILDTSIVFIQDANKIWTHGTYYDCAEVDLSQYALASSVPTKTSQLTNDSGYITSGSLSEEICDIQLDFTATSGTFTTEQIAKMRKCDAIQLINTADTSVRLTYSVSDCFIGEDTGYLHVIALNEFLGAVVFYELTLTDNYDNATWAWTKTSESVDTNSKYKGLSVSVKTSSNTTLSATRNTAYIWRGTGPASLTVTLPTSQYTTTAQATTEEIMLEFQVPSSSFSLTLNGTVAWSNGETPIFESGATYQIHMTARHTTTTNAVTWLAVCSPKFTVTYS